MASVDKFKVLPVNLGSKMLPNNICKTTRPTAVNIGCCNVGAVISEYNIGNPQATIAPIVGI